MIDVSDLLTNLQKSLADSDKEIFTVTRQLIQDVCLHLNENVRLRTERVQLQGENESLRADLEALKRTNATLLDKAAEPDDLNSEEALRANSRDIEVLAERLAGVEDRLAAAHSRITQAVDTIGQRIAELVEKTGGTIPGHETLEERITALEREADLEREVNKRAAAIMADKRPPLTPEQRDTFGRGDEVRVDMAQTQGGKRIFGWYVVEQLDTDISGFTVQVSPTEGRGTEPKRLFWIKPEDVLEVRKPTR